MRRSRVVLVLPWLSLGAGCVSPIESPELNPPPGTQDARAPQLEPVRPEELRRDAGTPPERSAPERSAPEPPSPEPEVPSAPAERRCATPPELQRAPQTIAEAFALMNALPKPTSLACFVESLPRPLRVYLTSSTLSAQPAAGQESPRIFVINEPLFLAFVPGGPAEDLLEMGWRTSPDRAIRTEVVFPLRRRVTAEEVIDHIALTDRNSFCGNCHFQEVPAQDDFLGDRALESNVNQPDPRFEVELDWLRGQLSECDPSASARCELLEALFAHGEVLESQAFAARGR